MINENKQFEKISFSKESPIFYGILIIVGIIAALLNTFLVGNGNFFGFIFQTTGYIGGTIVISWIMGFVPVLILHKKIKNARIKIYGTIFLFLCILTVAGNFYRN